MTSKQPWLGELKEQLESLLYDDCQTQEEASLIIDLLQRFYYLDNSQFQKKLNELAEAIVTDAELADTTTVVAGMTANSLTDSGQFILYGLKSLLEKHGWRHYMSVNRYDHVYKQLKKSTQYKDIVLVDEFIGSGQTVLNRVTTLKDSFKGTELSRSRIRVKVIAATNTGLKKIKDAGIEVETLVHLDKGISDHYSPEQTHTMINHMISIEGCLQPRCEDRDLPSLGYNRAEALYAREDGNTPNSVFPVFWWRFYNNGKERQPLLYRAMGDA